MINLTRQSKELKTDNAFELDTDGIDSNMCLVDLCPKKIEKYWIDNNWYQRSPNVTSYKHELPWDADPKRLISIVKATNKGISMPPIDIHVGFRNRLCFPDGRHRSVLAMINEHSTITAKVKLKDKQKILELLAA